jgi:hypothetical protein
MDDFEESRSKNETKITVRPLYKAVDEQEQGGRRASKLARLPPCTIVRRVVVLHPKQVRYL